MTPPSNEQLKDAQANRQQSKSPPRVLAIASAGGHWEQLRRLSAAFDNCDTHFASTSNEIREQLPPDTKFHTVIDANAWTKFKMAMMLLQVFALVIRLRPDVIVTTGAAPGYFAVRFGKLVRARTLWVDSIANAEELSRSGRLAKDHATQVASQWEHVAHKSSVRFEGSVL